MRHRRYVVQRADTGLYWAGEREWVKEAQAARAFRSKPDAVNGFVLDYPLTKERIAFHAVRQEKVT